MSSHLIEVNFDDINNANNEEVVDYVVEEEDEEELEELPINLESCLLLNTVYVESIEEMKQFLVSKRRENESRQTELKNNSNLKIVRDVTINNYGYSHPNSLIPFMAPYFKDVRGLTAPYNADTIAKRAKGEINLSYLCTNKPWNITERERLQEILQFDITQRLHKPLRDEKEALTKDKSNIASNIERIQELTAQIEDLNSVDPFQIPVPDRWDEGLDWLKFATELDTDHNAEDCELYWNNFLHPTIKKSQWTKQEDQRLEELVKILGNHNWETVAQELGTGRLGWQCCSRYQSELNRDIKRVGPLTKAEAELVEKVIEQCRVGDFIPWHQVKYFIEGRTLPQIKHYWNKINVPKRGNIWAEDENKQLLLAVKKYGTHNWRKVAQFLPGRSNRQCRERYMMRLNFGNERKLGDWTPEEDKMILELAPEHDFHWVKLESHMNGRNARQIASRYELLMKYKSKGKNIRKTKNKFGNKSCFGTRTLTVKNKLYEKIRQLINRDKSEDLDRQLRIGKQKLSQKLGLELKGITIPSNKGRPKKSNAEENLDSKIVDMFATFDVQKSSHKKSISRSAQDQCVYETTKNIFNELLCGQSFDSNTELAEAIRLLIDKSVSTRPKQSTTVSISEPSTSKDVQSDNWRPPPPILPPNRTTVKGLRGLLINTDYFSQIIAKSEIPLEVLSNAIKGDQNYAKLFAQFKALFYWPALLSMVDPPQRQQFEESEFSLNPKGVKSKRKSWLKTDSSRMIEIRTNQTKLIHTEMERNSKNKIKSTVNEESLNESSTGAPWYLTHKDRKYYNLKSLDKKSFVFTRIKPKHDIIPEKPELKSNERKKTYVESNEDNEDNTQKRRRKRKKLSKTNDNEFHALESQTEQTLPSIQTRSQIRRSARIGLKSQLN